MIIRYDFDVMHMYMMTMLDALYVYLLCYDVWYDVVWEFI